MRLADDPVSGKIQIALRKTALDHPSAAGGRSAAEPNTATAQFYLGAESGWTGLEGTNGSVTGTNPVTGVTATVPINHSFNDGFNVGARAGYMFGPWRFEGEYSYRQNTSNATVVGSKVGGTLDTNTLMFNGIYDLDFGWPVTPHIDRSGSPAYNQRLSERRANNVAKALAGMGVPRTQMAVSGHGENDNRVPTADGVREPQNRWVEITS